MVNPNSSQVDAALQRAAEQLSGICWMDQATAIQATPVAEAVANMFMVVFYQAETGEASAAEFQEALDAIRLSLASSESAL